ncbi:hypothetical protein FW774_08615 [Pedobacter sp. BS3]|uniref:OmpP1/FadL family transporter n=1 Tax=Pedobacter sp. BS3 TaxID=2567937 RepID=UPI0011EDB844|nr:outer membrane protein transport protein [Pedobacter sp. BS3]TZF85018.1 hypothetical protein FW774_08615 [Pedobacter sp. BS3]
MKYRYIGLAIAGIAMTGQGFAQMPQYDYYKDALRFSQIQPGSTSRFKAMGNASIALGGDISSLSSNPAGLGLFTRSEFSFTPEFINSNANSAYLGTNSSSDKSRVNINNVGLVFYGPSSRGKGSNLTQGVLSFNFGVGYSKINDFTGGINFTGTNSQNSVSEFYAENYADAIGEAAYKSYLISTYDDTNYFSSVNKDKGLLQQQKIMRKGSQSEVNFAGAVNISNKIYIGASVNLLNIRYLSNNTFTEIGQVKFSQDANGNTVPDYYADYHNEYYQNYDTKGSGVNLKLGIIGRLTDNFRLGFNVQTPSWYSIEDNYSENLYTHQTDNPYFTEYTNSPEVYPFTYNLTTPAVYSFGASLLNGKIGLISADVEFVDYSSIKLKTDDANTQGDFIDENRYITNNYGGAVNFRIGGELRLAPQYFLRAGYSLLGSPYQNSNGSDNTTNIYNAGLGYRAGNISVDLAYQNLSYKTQITPYELSSGGSPVANTKLKNNNLFLTVSARF